MNCRLQSTNDFLKLNDELVLLNSPKLYVIYPYLYVEFLSIKNTFHPLQNFILLRQVSYFLLLFTHKILIFKDSRAKNKTKKTNQVLFYGQKIGRQ